jgi:hypothetical protein
VEAVAIIPIDRVAIETAASVVIGSSQLNGVARTSFQSPTTSARNIESNRPTFCFLRKFDCVVDVGEW